MNATADAFFGIFGMTRVEPAPMKLDVVVPIEVTRGLNDREHFRVRGKRVKAERAATHLALLDCATAVAHELLFDPEIGARVTLLRPFARTPLDSDNLSGAFKGVRDEVASFIGVDDKSERIHWRYCQTKARKFDEGARPRVKLGLDTHIRIRIEIVPASEVDPMVTAARVLREALVQAMRHVSRGDEYAHQQCALAINVADALASFNPQEMYV